MDVQTDTERVRHSRKMVLEFLGSSVDLLDRRRRDGHGLRRALRRRPGALRPAGRAARGRRAGRARARPPPRARRAQHAATVAQPVKVDNDLYVRDYSKCILCYKCVEACGEDAQNTFAIAVAGRGFDARISTEQARPAARLGVRLLRQLHRRLPDRRADVQVASTTCARPGTWDETRPDRDRHDLPVLRRRLHARAPRPGQPIVKVTSPLDSSVTERPPLHQGPLRLPVRPEPRAAPGRAGRRAPEATPERSSRAR